MTCVEMSNILRSFLGAEDDFELSSHSMKSTTLSWSSKAEMPREYRRILGRHSSSTKEADSVYSRDLSFGPVRALERVFVMIREKSFAPDGKRSQFFPLTPQPGAAPAFPPTPVFQACAPETPVVKAAAVVPEQQKQCETEEHFLEVKEEVVESDGLSVKVDSIPASEIEISSESEPESSTEGETDLESSSDEVEKFEPSPKVPRLFGVAESPPLHEVWIQNRSSKIIHAVDAVSQGQGGSVMTKCGRKSNDNFDSVAVVRDWTAKCRVCFKGRRQPEVG